MEVASFTNMYFLLQGAIEYVRRTGQPMPITPEHLKTGKIEPGSRWTQDEWWNITSVVLRELGISGRTLVTKQPSRGHHVEFEATTCGDLSVFAALQDGSDEVYYYLAPRDFRI